jgi:hypothetical protein
MDKTDHLMAENNENNKDSQKGQVTPKNIKKRNLRLDKSFENKISFIGLTHASAQIDFL